MSSARCSLDIGPFLGNVHLACCDGAHPTAVGRRSDSSPKPQTGRFFPEPCFQNRWKQRRDPWYKQGDPCLTLPVICAWMEA